MKSTRLTLILLVMFILIPYTSNTYAQQALGTDQFQFRTLTGHTYDVSRVIFSPDGQTLVSIAGSQIICWDVATGSEKARIDTQGNVGEVVFSPDGPTLVTWDLDTGFDRGDGELDLIFWDVTTGREKNRSGLAVSSGKIQLSPDGQTLVAWDLDIGEEWFDPGEWHLILWDIATGSEKARFGPFSDTSWPKFSPDSQTLVSEVESPEGYKTILWDVATGREKARFGPYSWSKFSPDSQTLVSAGKSGGEIIFWDVATGIEKARSGPFSRASRTEFSPDSQTLVSSIWNEGEKFIILLDVATGREKARFGPLGAIDEMRFSPDGQTLAVAEVKGKGVGVTTIIVADVATGREKARFGPFGTTDGQVRFYPQIRFSPDSQTLAGRVYTKRTVWEDLIIFWDVATGRKKNEINDGVDPYFYFSSISKFSPDGQILAGRAGGFSTGGVKYDASIILWDVATGTPTARLTWGSHRLFSPDGQTLVTTNGSTITLWELPATQVHITPFPAESPSIGAQLTLNVAIVAGQNVGGYQVTVWFDETALRYVESANGDYLPPGAFAVPPEISDSKVTLAATSLAGTANGDGTLVTLTFEVVDIKESKLFLSDIILTDSTGEPLPHRFIGGLVTDPQIGPEDVNSDGVVNILDLVKVASRFNQHRDIEKEDINGDGIVNIVDLVKVAGAIGGGAAAPSLHPQTLAMFTAADVQKWLSAAQQLNLTDATSQRGILFLENLLAALTPKETALLANYPNPFNPETWIPYQLAKSAEVSISIYTVDGRLVRVLDLGHRSVGNYESRSRAAYWDGRNALGEPVASGVYFYTLKAGDFSATRKMLIRK